MGTSFLTHLKTLFMIGSKFKDNHEEMGDIHFLYSLITSAISLDPDQAQQHVGPDLDPNYLTL